MLCEYGTPPVNFTGMTFLHDDPKPLTDPRYDTVDFDTGSSDLFLPSPSCDSSYSGHRQHDPDASSTAHDLYKPFSLFFGDGSMSTARNILMILSALLT